MERCWDTAYSEAANEIASVRRDMGNFDARALSVIGSEKESILRARASTHVWLSAIVERFITEWLKGICDEFNAVETEWSKVRLSLFAIACGSELQSLAGGVKKGTWARRVAMFDRTSDNNKAAISFAHVPLDGRTIRPSHLYDIWSVFGFGGSPFPSPLHQVALEAIANQRNDVAHGHIRPAEAGAAFTYQDYGRHIARVEDIVEHIVICTERYFREKIYLRR